MSTILVVELGSNPSAAKRPRGSRNPLAKNVIIMIGDGWGFSHLEAASYFEYGKGARQIYNRFTFNWAMSTYPSFYREEACHHDRGYWPEFAWTDFDYVNSCCTDSAAAATAMSTGVKTHNGAVGVDMDKKKLKHALELAEELGKATGVVSSVQFSHATPASFVAHNEDRNAYEEIAQEMINESAADVIMSAGHPSHDQDGQFKGSPTYQYVGGQATWAALVSGRAGGDADGDGVADPWVLIQNRAEFQRLASGPTPKRVLGVARVHQTLQQRRSGNPYANPYAAPLITTVPTLEEMTLASLNVLDDDPDGLFLMIEGGAIDWASHSNQSGRMIEEALDFERSVEAVINWVQQNSDWGETLLIVTGDHETGYLTGRGSGLGPVWRPIVNNGAGKLPGMEWHSPGHTNSLIMLSAKGDTAGLFREYVHGYDPVRGHYIDNTSVGRVVFQAMRSR